MHGPQRRARDIRPHVARRRPGAGRSDAAVDRLARPADACRVAYSVGLRLESRAGGGGPERRRSRCATLCGMAVIAVADMFGISGRGNELVELLQRSEREAAAE